MINNGTAYDDAYFEINYVKVYSNTAALTPTVSGGTTVLASDTAGVSATGSASGSAASASGSAGSGSGSNAAAVAGVRAGLAMWGATVCAAFVWALL